MKGKMKRITALLLALFLVLSVAGCKAKVDPNKTLSGDDATESTDDWGDTWGESSEENNESKDDSTSESSKSATSKSTTSKSTSSSGQFNYDGKSNTDITWPKLDFKGQKKVKILTFAESTTSKEINDELKSRYDQTVELVITEYSDISTRLASLVMSGDSPDMCVALPDSIDFYSFAYKNLAQPIEPYVDFKSSLYRDMQWYYGKTKLNGSNYMLIYDVSSGPMIVYNKKIFRDCGVEEPWSLYKKGQWNWDKMKEIGPLLCADTNGDGTMDRRALAFNQPQYFMYSTGQSFGKLDLENKKAVTNVKNKSIARAANYMLDACWKDQWAYDAVVTAQEKFRNETVAMFVNADGGLNAGDVAAIGKRGDLGLAPLPKDPQADKLFYWSYVSGFYIAKGAKNPAGAVAFNAVRSYLRQSSEEIKKYNTKLKSELGFTDLNLEQLYENTKAGTPVMEMASFLGTTTLWKSINQGTPWTTQIAEEEWTIQKYVDDIFK